ncbi:ATP-binding protein [Aquincola tertiaricarbonis]|uniref:histidine kinase n=1 Tax=Aquincola tertiaricarbonis TaxID=391953 RepID=A0ABY4S8X6_AQUTE|nr:sensor histidine kinase [Aquincola tertiaricarbonis]URI09424.1 ATP-binding protein [Aquincola tertiaricarbonis]
MAEESELHFDVSTGLKRVLGRELITDDEVAIFELVKNSFDANANTVRLHFEEDQIVIADNGDGMSYEDLTGKWLFVAYSAKRSGRPDGDFRNVAADRRHYAGSKGIGRFSSDRLGASVLVQSRKKGQSKLVQCLLVDWDLFENDAKEHFDRIPVTHAEQEKFDLPKDLRNFEPELSHGTVITIRQLRRPWPRPRLLDLKASLAKLINPFGQEIDGFGIHLSVPAERAEDKRVSLMALKKKEKPLPREIVNGQIGNFIFSTLKDKTTFIRVVIEEGQVVTTLTDRGELIYKIAEPNPYPSLVDAGFSCEIYYLNLSAKTTFARRVGLPSIQFGSVFLFRNGFRVFPIGEESNDWFGFNRRKQQGFSRFLGSREIIGRVDVSGSDEDFQEASSRNQGLIDTPAVAQLRRAVMEHCLKRLERYVVPVSWTDAADGKTDDLSRLLTDPGRARVSAAVANLVDNDKVQLIAYSRKLVDLINERSSDFESSLVSLRAIAEKTGDKKMLARLESAERRFDDLKKSEADARRVANKALAAAEAASIRAATAEAEIETERRRAHFLESFINVDSATILNLHHQVTIYAVDIAQQIENFLTETAGKNSVPRETVLRTLEQMAFLNRKVMSVTKFAAKATFKLDSEKIDTDLPGFIFDYIEQIAKTTGSARLQISVENLHPGMRLRFNPIDASIIVDNLVSNARKARASRISFVLSKQDRGGLIIRVEDNGRGLAPGTNRARIFEMGYTSTQGSGLGLYHVRQALGEMGGSIELDDQVSPGLGFIITITARSKSA